MVSQTRQGRSFPLFLWGINHKTASIDIRERLFIPKGHQVEVIRKLGQTTSAVEGLLLSTCNRTEYYAVGGDLRCRTFLDFWVEKTDLSPEQLHSSTYYREKEDVVRHLFEVTSGLDSLVLGETQILSQVKEAYERAQQGKTLGPRLHVLFQKALQMAKSIHTQTRLASFHASIPSVALEFAENIFDLFADKRILVMGTGEVGWLIIHLLSQQGLRDVTVVSRSMERAREWGQRFALNVSILPDMIEQLSRFDVILSCTTTHPFPHPSVEEGRDKGPSPPAEKEDVLHPPSERYLLTREQFLPQLVERRFRPVLLLDLSVPRTMDPALGQLENVFLYNVDDLQQIVQQNFQERQKEAEKARVLIQEAVALFLQEQEWSEAAQLITTFRERAKLHSKIQLESLWKNTLAQLTSAKEGSLNEAVPWGQTNFLTALCEEPLGTLKEKLAASPAGYEWLYALAEQMEQGSEDRG